MLDTALEAELTEYLGHEHGQIPIAANMRNGARSQTVLTGDRPFRDLRCPAIDFSRRTGSYRAKLLRIQRVFGRFQCLQGLESSSSPTARTVLPQVRESLGLQLFT